MIDGGYGGGGGAIDEGGPNAARRPNQPNLTLTPTATNTVATAVLLLTSASVFLHYHVRQTAAIGGWIQQ